jgi:adenine-specific DNA-methyltransferase
MIAKMTKEQVLIPAHAKHLRHDSTDAERKLWRCLRDRQLNGFKFRRQQPIGRYVVDFFCSESKLVIELDGGHHTDQIKRDQRRTEFLNKAGYRVLRFWDHEVLAETEAVLQQIIDAVNPPHPALSLQGRGYRKDNSLSQRAREQKNNHPSPPPSPSRGEGEEKQGAREKNRATA